MNIRKVNRLCVTESICYPRSGHQMVLDVLQAYFGERLVYCEVYLNPDHQIDLDPATNYQKNHDFDGATRVQDDRKYLVQIRNPIDAIASRWAMERRAETEIGNRPWQINAAEWAEYWAHFFTKWVVRPVPNRLVVRYEELLDYPIDVLSNIIQFVQVEPHTDIALLTKTLKDYPVLRRRTKPIPELQIA